MPDATKELITRLFKESRDALRHYVARFVRSPDSADEIVQEAFLRTFENADSLETPRAFLFTTARHLAVDYGRKLREENGEAMRGFNSPNVVAMGPSLDEIVIADEASRILKQAIDLLPPQRRAALTLKILHGYSYREIGAVLGVAERTVENQVGRAVGRVHAYMKARYPQVKDMGGQDG